MNGWRAVVASVRLLGLAALVGWTADASPANLGESIYRRGVLGSGAPLEGSREAGGLRSKGADAACVNCHQRSGLGSAEGRTLIPPITGLYLFHPRATNADELNLPYVEGVRADRDPYTDVTLARAIREGLDSEGKPLSYLMPRFRMNDSDMSALIEYLKSLDHRREPGVTDTVLHFATIITSDADPVKRKGMLDVLEHYFDDKNRKAFLVGPGPRLRPSGRTMYSKTMFLVNRRWELHVWQLIGPASTWQAQLEQYQNKEPVMAAISGLGGKNWAPVHDFCEREALPCLFPNVEVPVDSPQDFYSLYFSKGVLLEAELIAGKILESGAGPPAGAVVQVYRAGDSGEQAAQALAAALKRHGITVRNHVLAEGAQGQDLAGALRHASTAQALVLWLRPADVAALGDAPARPATIYMSGLMGGLERSPLPSSWRARMHVAYPFDLPEKRRVRVDYPLGWFAIRHIPVVAEQVQADTYLACGLLAENLSHMVDTFIQDYLIERMQAMVEHRVITGYYPHLTLATHQHFASKGGYIVHFAEPSGTRLMADGNWLVP
jgi:Cytochrome c